MPNTTNVTKKRTRRKFSAEFSRHRCLGIVFAQLQLRAVWSHLLRNFDFELVESRYEPDYSRLLVGPRLPCRVRYKRRK